MSNSDKTQYLERQVVDRIFANTAPDGAIDGVYVMLFASEPANQPDETNQVSGDSYSPVQVTASEWTLDSQGEPARYVNTNEISFGVLDSDNTVTVGGVVLYDGADPATSNALYADSLAGGSILVSSSDQFVLSAGDLVVEEQ